MNNTMMIRCWALLSLLLGVSGVSAASVEGQSEKKDKTLEKMASYVVDAKLAGKPGYVVSPMMDQRLPLSMAYQIQTIAVKKWLKNTAPEGFKAGLTSKKGQKKFGATTAIVGVLLPGGQRVAKNGGYVVRLGDFNQPMMEAEIGFRLKSPVSKPINNIKVLKAKVASIVPVIELPDLAFNNRSKLNVVDIIANNVAAKQYIVGTEIPSNIINVDDLAIVVKKDNNLFLKGQASDAMGSQWQALLWLVNQSVANGWTIQPNQLLITGALGKMMPNSTGVFEADFGALGQINFTVVQ